MSPAEQLAVFVEVVEIDQRFRTYVTLETRDTPNTGCSCALCEHTQLWLAQRRLALRGETGYFISSIVIRESFIIV